MELSLLLAVPAERRLSTAAAIAAAAATGAAAGGGTDRAPAVDAAAATQQQQVLAQVPLGGELAQHLLQALLPPQPLAQSQPLVAQPEAELDRAAVDEVQLLRHEAAA